MNTNRPRGDSCYAATELILMEIFPGRAKTARCIVYHRSSRESVTVYCTWRWAGLGQQDHNNMLIVHHCRDIISRITLWWNWSQPLRAIQSDVGDFEIPLLSRTPHFHFYCPPLCRLHMMLDAAVGKAGLPTAASPTEMGKDASTQTPSSPPSAAADEWGCCRQVSCEFETAAERTHCALTTQSGSDAAQLPGTTGSIWHTHTRWETAGQIQGSHSNAVWERNPIILRLFFN